MVAVLPDHMQIICISLRTDHHASTSPLNFLQAGCSLWRPSNSVKALMTMTMMKYAFLSCHDLKSSGLDDSVLALHQERCLFLLHLVKCRESMCVCVRTHIPYTFLLCRHIASFSTGRPRRDMSWCSVDLMRHSCGSGLYNVLQQSARGS